MSMLKAFILEDEPQAIALLRIYIERIPFMELTGEARDPLKAFALLQEQEIDVLFLDINLPDLSGLELYKSLSQPPAVIFTTAYPEYAVEGFELEAVDYLLKPITFPRFLKACDRVAKRRKMDAPSTSVASPTLVDIIYIKSGPILHKVSWRDVLYVEKEENYVIYYTLEKRILSRQTLSDLEALFPSYFCRIHKSFAVSLLHLDRVEREFLQVGKRKLPIGRTFRAGFLASLNAL